ncbi:MAG TPA: hypothetical protein VFK13_13315 [Gemmatimonadaceae bacterium]|nr:hypothetical protein [Gemmatimonadaceae bacterium]
MSTAPRWLVVIAVIALLWNLLGCVGVLADLSLTADDVAALPAAQRAMYESRPAWGLAASALAVLAGVAGSIALLLRKRWASVAFALSLAGIVIQDLWLASAASRVSSVPVVPMLLQGVVLIVGIGLLILSRRAAARGWLT